MDLVVLQPGNVELFGQQELARSAATDFAGIDPYASIELISLHYGMQQQVSTDVSNSARTSGRPSLTGITCVKYLDQVSPRLYECCLAAKPIDSGDPTNPTKIHLLRSGGGLTDEEGPANYMTLELQNAIVTSVESQSHPNDMPTEQFVLNFTEIRWRYFHQAADSTGENEISTGWDIAKNRLA